MLLCPSDSRDYMVMKKLLFMLVALLPAFQGARADNVAQAIWCSGNTTLYFDYCATVGSTYNGQTVTAVYAVPTDAYNDSYPGWSAVSGTATTVVFKSAFNNFKPLSCYGWFHGFAQLTTIDGLSNLDTSAVTNMDFMFDGCSSLATLDVSTFDVSHVTTAQSMFFNCSNLTTIYCNKAWSIASTSSMFRGATKLRGYDASSEDPNIFNGTMASPAGYFTATQSVTLYDKASNESTISTWVSKKEYANVTLSGHTFYKDAYWNTLCLPFSMNSKQIAESPLKDAAIKELSDASLETSTGTLNLSFATVTSITAGKPYIVKWASGDNVTSPVFNNVSITSTTPEGVTYDNQVLFGGQYSPFEIIASGATTNNQGNLEEIILLSGENKLGYSKSVRTGTNALRSFCAHFVVLANPSSPTARVQSYVIDFGNDENATGIVSIENGKWKMENEADAWFSLDGRRLSGRPSAKGVYISNGKKVVIR